MSRELEAAMQSLDDLVGFLTEDGVRKLVETRRTITAVIEELIDDARRAQIDLSDMEDRLEGLKEEAKEGHARAIDAFLDEIDRPVGSLKFAVPTTAAVDRAILGLHDAVGRKL